MQNNIQVYHLVLDQIEIQVWERIVDQSLYSLREHVTGQIALMPGSRPSEGHNLAQIEDQVKVQVNPKLLLSGGAE